MQLSKSKKIKKFIEKNRSSRHPEHAPGKPFTTFFYNNLKAFKHICAYDCYEGDVFKFSRIDFSNGGKILNKNNNFINIIRELDKHAYLDINTEYAILYLIEANDISLKAIKKELNAVPYGIEFLNSNKNLETYVEFSKDNVFTYADIYFDDYTLHKRVLFRNCSDIQPVFSEIKELNNSRYGLINENILMDKLIEYFMQ